MYRTVNVTVAKPENINKVLSDILYNNSNSIVLSNNEDLNTILTPGKYILYGNGVINKPKLCVDEVGILIVETYSLDGITYYKQSIISTGYIFLREISIENGVSNISKWKYNGTEEKN